jgi:hypothetical protein
MIRTKGIIFCFFNILFFIQALIADGFLTGTLVKTTTGFLPIEQLQVNGAVLCFDLVNAYIARPIIYITTGALCTRLYRWYMP